MTEVKPTSHCGRVLAALSDGQAKTTRQLYRECGPMILHSRVADLRAKGYRIECQHIAGKGTGAGAYRYQWLDAPAPEPNGDGQLTITTDEIAPRVPAERYRIYGRPAHGDLQLIATVATPEALGVAIVTLGGEEEFSDLHLGILDTHGNSNKPGVWLVKPWVNGETL